MSTPQFIGPKLVDEQPVPPRLSAADMQEYRLRLAAVNRALQERTAAAHAHMLIEEACQQWLTKKVVEYGMQGKVTIDGVTGELKQNG